MGFMQPAAPFCDWHPYGRIGIIPILTNHETVDKKLQNAAGIIPPPTQYRRPDQELYLVDIDFDAALSIRIRQLQPGKERESRSG
jgi:hypothetical protein